MPLPKKSEIQYTTTDDKTSCNISGCIAEIANLLDCDPDPYFSGVKFRAKNKFLCVNTIEIILILYF